MRQQAQIQHLMGENFISSTDYGAPEAVPFLQRVFGSLFSHL
jgi:hypothetical protein